MKKRLTLLFILCIFLFSGCNLNSKTVSESTLNQESVSIADSCITVAPSKLPLHTPAPPAENTQKENNAEATNTFDPYKIISTMSDEELVGQLFLARAPELSEAQDKASEYHLGGYILFGNHTQYETKASLKTHIDNIQSAANIPLLIAVDEEGGTVSRISRFSQYRESAFPSPRKLYSEGGISLILKTESEKCDLLKSLGINLNLAPVCDITNDQNAFMYSRSLGESPEITADYVKKLILLYKYKGMGTTLKHFPGYGNNKDTHTGIAADERSLNELITNDLIPFIKAINSGADSILVSHTFINALDETKPASLSPLVINFLRKEMKFEGVIVTDDLFMEAITDLYGAKESAVLAIEAGADLLISTEFEIQYEAVLNALKEGRIKRENLEKSAARVLIWKHKLGLIN